MFNIMADNDNSNYSSINNNDESKLEKTISDQGIKFKKYQKKIEKKTEKKNLLFEGFRGLEGNLYDGPVTSLNLGLNLDLQNTDNLINKTNKNVTYQIAELQKLQQQFNTILDKYENSNEIYLNNINKESINLSNDIANTNVYVNQMVNNAKSKYVGCWKDGGFDNPTNPMPRAMTTVPPYDETRYVKYDDCKQHAVNTGFKYFALQNKNASGLGQCFLSNNLADSEKYGVATNDNAIPLWASGTNGKGGNTAELLTSGSLIVKDTTGNVIFQTPSVPYCTTGYGVTRKADAWGNDIGFFSGGIVDVQYCKNKCDENYNCTGFAMDTGSNHACWIKTNVNRLKPSNNRDTYAKYPVQSIRNFCNFKLILQDDGNMCVYPLTSTTAVWASGTNGRQRISNPNYSASHGKYGLSYLLSGQVLAKGEWIGSVTGNIKLIMQTDGNLVLYTSNPSTSCTKSTDGNIYGGGFSNAIYELDKVGIMSNYGKLGYVDKDLKVSEYPASMFSINPTTKLPVISNSTSCPKNSINIDTLQWGKISKTNVPMTPSTICVLKDTRKYDQNTREELKKYLAIIAKKIVDKIIYLKSLNVDLVNQMGMDKNTLKRELETYQRYNDKFNNYDNSENANISGILKDTNIVVLQENYDYLFWSILAVAIVVITINTIKK